MALTGVKKDGEGTGEGGESCIPGCWEVFRERSTRAKVTMVTGGGGSPKHQIVTLLTKTPAGDMLSTTLETKWVFEHTYQKP